MTGRERWKGREPFTDPLGQGSSPSQDAEGNVGTDPGTDPGQTPDNPPTPSVDDQGFTVLATPETVYVIVDGTLNLRAAPSVQSDSIASLTFGKQLQRIAVGESWSKVIYEGKEGYVFSEYITTDNLDTSNYTVLAAPKTMYVTAKDLWVRYYPSMLEASIVPYTEHPGLHFGDTVQCVAISPDSSWARVIINGNTYYVGYSWLSETVPGGYVGGEDTTPDYPSGK